MRQFHILGICTLILLLSQPELLAIRAGTFGATPGGAVSTESSAPTIELWYGPEQTFGHLGTPQRWINVLGRAHDPEGIASLVYSLNGGPDLPLSMGPDGLRLAAAGDFNVEIDVDDLDAGENQVVITATDTLDHRAVQTVTVTYSRGLVWPLPYTIDWHSVTNIQDVAQVADGQWVVEGGSVRPVGVSARAYDRRIVIGDMSWTDYEVTVPIVAHQFFGSDAGVGILARWNGHSDDGRQPRYGHPYGGLGWYRLSSLHPCGQFSIRGNGRSQLAVDLDGRQLALGVPTMFKLRVETQPTGQSLYLFKVWEAHTPEPPMWDLGGIGAHLTPDETHGSLALVAHRTDASFGTVTITGSPFEESPVISNIQVAADRTSATLRWDTKQPSTSSVAYGQSTGYEQGRIEDEALVVDHIVTLRGLTPQTHYHYQVTSVDDTGRSTSSADLTFTTAGPVIGAEIVSDDFDDWRLDAGPWRFVDPVGDADLGVAPTRLPGSWISISVPAGTYHNAWRAGVLVPHLMQPARDADFEIEVKFDSAVSHHYQIQGILVMQSEEALLRFDFHSDGTKTRIFAASFTDGVPTPIVNKVIADSGTAPLYMRIRRVGDRWTQLYSFDGISWMASAHFTFALRVASVGLFAGNTGSHPPAHTTLVDYFSNVASPVTPEGEHRGEAIGGTGDGTAGYELDVEGDAE